MLVAIEGKQFIELHGKIFIITASFHNKDITQNIKNANHYMSKPNNEDGVICVSNNGSDIYLSNTNDLGTKSKMVMDLLKAKDSSEAYRILGIELGIDI